VKKEVPFELPFDQVVLRSLADGASRDLEIGLAGEDDDRHVRGLSAQAVEGLQADAVRKPKVEEDEIDLPFVEKRKALVDPADGPDRVAPLVRSKDALRHEAVVPVVLDEEDADRPICVAAHGHLLLPAREYPDPLRL